MHSRRRLKPSGRSGRGWRARAGWPRLAVVLSLVLVLVGPAAAQQESMQEDQELMPPGQAGFFYLFPTRLELVGDQGRSPDVDEEVFLITPLVVSVGKSTPRTNFYAVYEPEFEVLSGHGEINSWNHAGAVTVNHRLTPDLTFDAGGKLLDTNDPARRVPETLVALPSGRLLETTAYGGISYRLGRFTVLRTRLENTITDIDSKRSFGLLPIDREGTSASIGVSHALSRSQRLSFDYTALRPLLFVDDEILEDPDLVFFELTDFQSSASVGYTHFLDATTRLTVAAVAVYVEKAYPGAVVELEKEWADYWLKARYARVGARFAGFLHVDDIEGKIPLPLPDNYILENVSNVVSVDLDGELREGIYLRHRLRASRSNFVNVDLDSFTLSANVRLEYRRYQHAHPYFGFEYLGDGLGFGVRRRLYVGIDFFPFQSPSRPALQQELTRRRTFLPYGEATGR